MRRFRDEAKALKRCAEFKGYADTIVAGRSDVLKVSGLPIHYFLLDVAPGEPLADYLKKTPPPWKWSDALSMIGRVAWALTPAHLAFLAHRDLHPGNIFCDNSALKLDVGNDEGHPGIYILDFGVSADIFAALLGLEDESVHTFRPVGSVYYASPEALNNPATVTQDSDMWSLGVLLYHLLSGRYPFKEPTLSKLMDATTAGHYHVPRVEGASVEEEKFTLNVLSFLLNPVPSKRFKIGNLRTAIDDALYRKSIPVLAANLNLWKFYFSYCGDIWMCPRCLNIVHPDGSRCPSCGTMNDDWLNWLCTLGRNH